MTRIYGYAETLYSLIPESTKGWVEGSVVQVPGFVDGQVLPNPYYAYPNQFSPIGLVLMSMWVDVEELENMSIRHVRDCDDTEDPDEPCVVCAEGADNSIYTEWVQQWLSAQYDIGFTSEALDLLWDAEKSGLTLSEWLEVQKERTSEEF